MKVLVTGGLGLIGSHIAKRLISEGHSVRIFDIRVERTGAADKHLDFFKGDVALLNDCVQAVKGCDAVIHTAAIARTMETIGDPLRAHDVNATGTLNLLMAAKGAGVKRFVHSSSSILYVPETPYFVGKQCAESYVSIYASLYGLSTISLRYANVYGPGQSQEGAYPNVIASMAKLFKETGVVIVSGDGEQNRSFIHVSDVVTANLKALESQVTGTFDIGTNVYTSINEIASWFKELGAVVTHGKERKGDVKTIRINTSKAKNRLKFEAKVVFSKEAIKSYL